jgi:hypothetical protein
MTRKGGVKSRHPLSLSLDFAQWPYMQIAEIVDSRILVQSALPLIFERSLLQRTGGPLHPYVPQSH